MQFVPRGGDSVGKYIQNLELRYGFFLPDDYRQFLLETNGGDVIDGEIDVDGCDYTPTDLNVFFGFGVLEPFDDIDKLIVEMNTIRDISKIIPIASDSGGSYFCIDVGSAKPGAIYFFEWGSSERPFRVANSFSEFFAMIK
jgi:SMI1 / KNR4 family (SUKH-1)